ncbi:MAG: SDR family oxidoreductase, partial [Thermomicrobia bacterium]|nr:SDR family oxidoreductase [Thermomicrobia bacterium]
MHRAVHSLRTARSGIEVAPKKQIRVNYVAPGPVWMPLNVSDNKAPEAAATFGEQVPMKRLAQLEEIAP